MGLPGSRRAGRRSDGLVTRIGSRTGSSGTTIRRPRWKITLVGPELRATGELVCAVAGALFELFVDERPRRMRAGVPRRERGHAAIRPAVDWCARHPGVPWRDRRASCSRQPRHQSRQRHGTVRWPGPRLRRCHPGRPPGDGSSTARGAAAPSSRRRSTPARDPRATRDALRTCCARALVFRAFHGDPQSNRMGYRLEGPALPYGEVCRHPLGRHAARFTAGAERLVSRSC